MERNQVFRKVVEAIRIVQETSGRDLDGIIADTNVYAGIDGFDSLNGIEATVILSESLGNTELPDDLFLPEDGHRDITVGEIANRICDLVKAEASVR